MPLYLRSVLVREIKTQFLESDDYENNSRDGFGTQENIHDGTFYENSQQSRAVSFFRKKIPPLMFVWILNTSLNLFQLSLDLKKKDLHKACKYGHEFWFIGGFPAVSDNGEFDYYWKYLNPKVSYVSFHWRSSFNK